MIDELEGLLTAPTARMAVSRLRAGVWGDAEDELAEEVPVAFEYNGVSHAVMLATSKDIAEFALGFSLSEGIIGSAREFYGVEIEENAAGITALTAGEERAATMAVDRRRRR